MQDAIVAAIARAAAAISLKDIRYDAFATFLKLVIYLLTKTMD